jgi:hypothetical protein
MSLFGKYPDGKRTLFPDILGEKGELYGATITVGAETGGNTINVAIQLTDPTGANLAKSAALVAYLSDDAAGLSITATGPSTETAIGTDGDLGVLLTKKVYLFVSEADGSIDVDVVESGSATWYLVLVMPNGSLVVSDAIAIT